MDSIDNYAQVNNTSDSEDENEKIRNSDVDVLRDIGLRFEEEINEDLNDFPEANILESQFKTEDEAYIFYNVYAKLKGFSVRKDMLKVKNGISIRRRFVCSCAGKRRENLFNLSNQKKNLRRLTRCDCLAMLSIVYSQTMNMWIVREFVTNHTHNLAPRDFLRSHRKVDVNEAVLSNNLYTLGMSKKQLMELLVARVGGHASAGCTIRDFYNHMNRERVKRCIDGDANAVNAYMCRGNLSSIILSAYERSMGAKVIKKRKRKTKSNELKGAVDMGDAYLHKDANGNPYWKLKDL